MRLLCRAATSAALLVVLSPLLPAQQRSLAPDLAGFGGPHYKLTLLNGAPAMLGGGPAYVAVNQWFSLGVNGSYPEGDAESLMIAYGGPSMGITVPIASWLGVWMACTIGPGWAELPAGAPGGPAESALLVVEPEVALMIGLGSSSRIGIGASYRLALPFAPLGGLDWGDLSGFSGMLMLQYGVFRRPSALSSEAAGEPRLSLAGCVSQKFALVRGQVARFDGGYTGWSSTTAGPWARGGAGQRTGYRSTGMRFA